MNTEMKKWFAERLGWKITLVDGDGSGCCDTVMYKGFKGNPTHAENLDEFEPTDSPYYWQILEGLGEELYCKIDDKMDWYGVLGGMLPPEVALWYNDNRTEVLEAIYTVIGEG